MASLDCRIYGQIYPFPISPETKHLIEDAIPIIPKVIASIVKEHHLKPAEAARQLKKIAAYYFKRGRYQHAYLIYLEERRCREVVSATHSELGTTLRNIGRCQFAMGRFQEALETHQKVLTIWKVIFPRGSDEIVGSLFDSVLTLRMLQQFEKAEKVLQDAVQMQKNGSPNLSELAYLDSLFIHVDPISLGQVEASKEMNPAQMEIDKRRITEGADEKVAKELSEIALRHLANGNAEQFLKICREVLEMRKGFYPSGDHPNLAESWNWLGIGLQHCWEFKEALDHHQKALDMLRQIYGTIDHLDIAHSLSHIGRVQMYLGYNQQALSSCNQALNMRRKLKNELDKENKEIAIDLNAVGTVLCSLGRFPEALKHHRDALALLNYSPDAEVQEKGSNHRQTDDLLDHIPAVAPFQKAGQYLGQALAMKNNGSDPLVLQDVKLNFRQLLEWMDTLPVLCIHVPICGVFYDEREAVVVASSLNSIGNIYEDMGLFNEALKQQQNALFELFKAGFYDHPLILLF